MFVRVSLLAFLLLPIYSPASSGARVGRTVARCIDDNEPVIISSLGRFLRGYSPNTARTWLFAAETFKCVYLTFSDFDIESSPNCERGSVTLYNGASVASPKLLSSPLCGYNYTGTAVVTTTNAITVVFESDGKIAGRGFKARVQQVSCSRRHERRAPGRRSPTVIHNCLSKDGFVIFSYPRRPPYRTNIHHHWMFISPPKTCLELTLRTFDIERSKGCSKDFVGVYDGISKASRQMILMCGSSSMYARATGTLPSVASSKNTISLTFDTDSSLSRSGFQCEIIVKNCTSSSGVSVRPPNEIVTPPVCGKPAFEPLTYLMETQFTDRIVGGRIVQRYSWPWQASLRYHSEHKCGGSIISRRHLLTAAHCFTMLSGDPSDFEVWVGKYNKQKLESSEQRLGVEAIIIHPNYGKFGRDSDLAIARLSYPGVVMTDQTQQVCLPSLDWNRWIPGANSSCYVTGFGETRGTGGEEFLKQAKVPIIPLEECRKNDHVGTEVTENMVCAGYYAGGHDSCQGDSGGPLVCHENDLWWLGGIVSFGHECAKANSPGVYARTSSFIRWIEDNAFDLVIP